MKIVSSHESSTGGGGFVQYCMSRANAIFIHRFIAKIPTGYSIAFTRYPIGEGGYQKWATDNKGTGGWKEYIYITYCGTSGDFGSFGYVYIEQSADVEWYLAYSDLFDITEGISGNLINQINISQEGVRIDANKIEISGATIFKDSQGNQVNIFGQGDDVFSINNGVFRVDKNGKATMMNAEVTGTIRSENGIVGGFEISKGYLKNGNLILSQDSISYEKTGAYTAKFGANLDEIDSINSYTALYVECIPESNKTKYCAAFKNDNKYIFIGGSNFALNVSGDSALIGNANIGKTNGYVYIAGSVKMINIKAQPSGDIGKRTKHLSIDPILGDIYYIN